MANADSHTDLRQSYYLVLIAVAVGIAAAKVLGAENVFEPSRYAPSQAGGYGLEASRPWPPTRPDPTPMMSSNDRSRWATVRALVEEGTYAIGKRIYPDASRPTEYQDVGIIAKGSAYDTLDKVLRPLTEDEKLKGGPIEKEFYSSKPPLYATLVAGEYWLLKQLFGWSIDADRWLVMTTILLTVNVLPLAVYLIYLARLIEAAGSTDFGRVLTFTTAAVGTFLTTFSSTLNNHLPGAICVFFACYPLLKAWAEGRDLSWAAVAGCGFFSGLAATFELPATALLAGFALALLVARRRLALLAFIPAAAIPIAAFFLTNYLAIGHWKPSYGEFGQADPSSTAPNYDYHGSHWKKREQVPRPRGIDFNDEPTTVYAFHLLFGHHGWFSLTPVWLLGLMGLLGLAMRSAPDVARLFQQRAGPPWSLALHALLTLTVSVVVFAFYLTRTQSYNYGGNTSGPRWLFWLIPLWILAVPSAADRLNCCRVGRLLAAALLAASVFSVFYPAWNPWRSPWIMQLLEFTQIKQY